MKELSDFAARHKVLFWDISKKDIGSLSDEAVSERIFSHGTLDNVKELFEITGIQGAKILFDTITSKRRVNLSPATVNYFTLYFQKNAS